MANNLRRIIDAVKRTEQKANVAGYVILKNGEHVGTIRISYPRDGAGRLTALVFDVTRKMPENVDFADFTRWQMGTANGGGYDKASAAISGATIAGYTLLDRGEGWANQLRNQGFDVIQAV